MGNSLSAAAPGRGGRRKGGLQEVVSHRAALDGLEGPSGRAWWVEGAGEGGPGVGSLAVSKDSVRWVASAEEVLGREPDEGAGTSPSCCASPLFSMPVAAVPAGAASLVGAQQWQLCWEAADCGDSAVMSIYLGCPTLPADARWRQLGVCCEFSLELRGLPSRGAGGEGGSGGWAGGRFHRREWLSHAFTHAEPDWGLRGVLSGLQAQRAELGQVEVELRFEGVAAHLQGPSLSGLVLHDSPPLLQISEEPCILAMDGFLSPAECQAVISLTEPCLKRSKVSAGDETPLRTSSGMFITGELAWHPVALALDARVQQLADLACRLKGRRRLALSEATQVVRYFESEYYAEHFDNRAGDCAKRAATVMVYLSDVAEGGTTSFPRSPGFPLSRALRSIQAGDNNHPSGPPSPASVLPGLPATPEEEGCSGPKPPGLRIAPRQGRAIVFWSQLPSGKEDKASIHAADPVGGGCTKWIATRWCREAT